MLRIAALGWFVLAIPTLGYAQAPGDGSATRGGHDNRVFVRFTDGSGAVRGVTSAAVRTQ